MDLYVAQLGHCQLQPSLQALVVRLTQFIAIPQVVQFMLLANRPLLFKKSIAATVPLAKIIGPRVDIDKDIMKARLLVNRQMYIIIM